MVNGEVGRGSSAVGVACLLTLAVSGLVLATSFMVPWPPAVFGAAAVVGLVALVGVVAVAFRDSRRSGRSVVGAAGHGVKDGLRFLRDFL